MWPFLVSMLDFWDTFGRMECQHLRFQDETGKSLSEKLPDILPLEMPFIISWRSMLVLVKISSKKVMRQLRYRFLGNLKEHRSLGGSERQEG